MNAHAIQARVQWLKQARDSQVVPEDDPSWSYLVVRSGRGFGKTRMSVEDCAWYAATHENESIAVICPTESDVRGTYFDGPSGFMKFCPPEAIAKKIESPFYKVIMTSGTVIRGFSAEKPDRLRGPQYHRAYADELAAWKTPKTKEQKDANSSAWEQLEFGLRLGKNPRVIITTTPRPIPLVRKLIADPLTRLVHGSTFDNAMNLSRVALNKYKSKYEGTRLGRQELHGELLEDVPGALWTRAMIDQAREPVVVPDFERVVIVIDPSGVRDENDKNADEVGIAAVAKGVDGRGYVLGDYSCRLSPLGWGRRAIEAYHRHGADRIIGERNYGGAMVEAVIQSVDPNVPYREVVASRGKILRAEPAAALYEQGRVSHVGEDLEQLEDQMCCMTSTGYVAEGSPDRVDAVVWGLTELFLGEDYSGFLGHYRQQAEEKKEAEIVKAVVAAGWLPPPSAQK
jgi:phage terminase large subunit-like protein